MAINETSAPPIETPQRTMLAGQYDDRMAAVPSTMALFVGTVDTAARNAYDLVVQRQAARGWRYFVKITDPALIMERQRFAMRFLVRSAIEQLLEMRELPELADEELESVLDGMFAAGVTFDDARRVAWEDLETRRRAGAQLPVTVDVAEGKEQLRAHGIPY